MLVEDTPVMMVSQEHEIWMMDCAGSYHITWSKDAFDEGSFQNCATTIQIGDGKTIHATGKGTCTRKTNTGRLIVLQEVLLVTNCPRNLLAEGRLDRAGAEITSKDGIKDAYAKGTHLFQATLQRNNTYTTTFTSADSAIRKIEKQTLAVNVVNQIEEFSPRGPAIHEKTENTSSSVAP